MQGAWPSAEHAQFAEVIPRHDRASRGQEHSRLAAQDDVERVAARPVRDSSFATSKLGEGCFPDELAQLALADAFEERERCKNLGPVAVVRAIRIPKECGHHAASCSARWANGW